MKNRLVVILVATASLCTFGSLSFAGDRYWSPAPGLVDVNDFAVCGTTVYAATGGGLFRSSGDPEEWQQLRGAYTTLVACSGSRVLWEEIVGVSRVVYVSHDAFDSFVAANGLADAISRGLRDLSIAGDTALVATRWGVDRSTDGGLNFPAAYPVLWDSSAGYEITAVWTNGTACAAAGSGGMSGNGIWYSPSGARYTWNLVLDTSGQAWLSGSGTDTIVSGSLYNSALDPGYVSTDGGASWNPLPLNWGAVDGHYQRPFVSGTRILSRHVYEIWDPGTGLFISHTNGPLFYDMNGSYGNDMDASLASEAEIRNQAIVEGADPYLLVAERDGAAYWFRSPGGWPAAGFDFTPPYSPSINASPRIAAAPATASTMLAPHAVEASHMYIAEDFYFCDVTHDVNGFTTTITSREGPYTGGWVPYASSRSWDPYPQHGMHTLYAWFADATGNITDPAVISGSTNFPQSLQLASGQPWGTYIYAKAGESFTIGGTAVGGDIDIFHWEPGSFWSDDWAATVTNDTLAFTADTTGYHMVIIWNYPGSGTFDGAIIAQPGLKASTDTRMNTKPAESGSGDPPPDDPPPYYEFIGPLIFSDGFENGGVSQWSS